MKSSTIKLSGISKSFPGVQCLADVDFAVLAGEIHALLGENGAGKSSLTRVMGGAMMPDSGSMEFEGRTVRWSSPREARAAGIHVIHQELALFPELTVAENILIDNQPVNWLGLIGRSELQKRAMAVLARLGAQIDPNALVGDLSVANQQIIEIAKALVGEVRLIIFDEPTAVISGQDVKMLFANMKRLKEQGVAIVYISHRLEEIFEIADRVTVLKDGKLVGTLPVKNLDRAVLVRMMVGRQLQDLYPPKNAKNIAKNPILTLHNISSGKRVRGVSLELSPGEIVGIGGMVGAGRTELAHAIFGSAALDGGEIIIDGISTSARTSKQSIADGMGFLTEDRKAEGLFQQLPISANILAPALAAITKMGFIRSHIERAIAQDEIKSYSIAAPSIDTRVIYLSGGNQQKVLFSRWARIAGKVLILDEPTRGVDVGAKVEIYKIIRSLADRGLGILLISSELPEIIGMADRVVVMSQGRVTGELQGAEITEENVMHLATVTDHAVRPGAAAGVWG